MGLDCSHGAFNGAYSSFHRMRGFICETLGGDWFKSNGNTFYIPDEMYKQRKGIMLLLTHSDCDGEFTPEEALQVHCDLEWFLDTYAFVSLEASTGHLLRCGRFMRDSIKAFSDGCKLAYDLNEPLDFG